MSTPTRPARRRVPPGAPPEGPALSGRQVALDQRVGELPLRAADLEPVLLERLERRTFGPQLLAHRGQRADSRLELLDRVECSAGHLQHGYRFLSTES